MALVGLARVAARTRVRNAPASKNGELLEANAKVRARYAPAAGADVRRALAIWVGLESRTGARWFETACCLATLWAVG